MRYSIIIPTYNNCDKFLKPCIDAVLKYSNISDIELIISANGCTDNTLEYVGNLKDDFDYLGFSKNLKIIWNPYPLGYPKATNAGIVEATCDKIVLLNNDAILLPQPKNQWLQLLDDAITNNQNCGISCNLKKYSEITKMHFAVFFCAMIDRKVIDKIGLLDESYGVGGNEDIDFSAAAQLAGFTVEQAVPMVWDDSIQLFVGSFPVWHQGEGTVHNPDLVQNFHKIFSMNELKLAKKYNQEWYEQHKDIV